MPTVTDNFDASRRHSARSFGATHPPSSPHRETATCYPGRTLKGLEDIIELMVLDPDSWFFSGRFGSAERDPCTDSSCSRSYTSKRIRAMREANQPGGGLYPAPLRADMDAMDDWVYGESVPVVRGGYPAVHDNCSLQRGILPDLPGNLRIILLWEEHSTP
ncbi:hypothetical protein Aspvir_001031 [Aspergillus viridinutans]|uniref:Uncharacterized protein n=1 Tax=Aspergillus viridinutans TaxID=75553 RepID=A0A9P3BLX6_ASPVI|nr:uncharacterized protein Aspvir_001031 [Aspergillus viridinutans]GIJ98909.1 hypothetical protein Aspvir_001031 [Aspergillus viridinutans]